LEINTQKKFSSSSHDTLSYCSIVCKLSKIWKESIPKIGIQIILLFISLHADLHLCTDRSDREDISKIIEIVYFSHDESLDILSDEQPGAAGQFDKCLFDKIFSKSLLPTFYLIPTLLLFPTQIRYVKNCSHGEQLGKIR
jgi:hypothetical protein